MAKRLWSIFTEDMDYYYFSGSPCMEWRRIFESRQGYREKSEDRGLMIPLRYDLHPNGTSFKATPENQQIDGRLKRIAQEYYEAHYGSRKRFRQKFGHNYLDWRYQRHIG